MLTKVKMFIYYYVWRVVQTNYKRSVEVIVNNGILNISIFFLKIVMI